MGVRKGIAILVTLLSFLSPAHGAALPEPAAAKISYALALRKKIEDATQLDKNTANLCAEYIPFSRITSVKKCNVNANTNITCLTLIGQRYVLANNTFNNTLEIFDSKTQQHVSVKSPHTIKAMLYKPPFTMITAAESTPLLIWDIRNGKTTHILEEGICVRHLTFVSNNQFAFITGNQVVFRDNYNNRNVYNPSCKVRCFLPFKENVLAVGLKNGKINLVDTNTYTPESGSQASEQPIISLARLSDDELVALDEAKDVIILNLKHNTISYTFDANDSCYLETHYLVTLNDEVITIPTHTHSHVGRVKKSSQGVLREDESLPLDVKSWILASSQNSFALLTREDIGQQNPPESIYIFGRENEDVEEKLDDKFEQWVTSKMSKPWWNFGSILKKWR